MNPNEIVFFQLFFHISNISPDFVIPFRGVKVKIMGKNLHINQRRKPQPSGAFRSFYLYGVFLFLCSFRYSSVKLHGKIIVAYRLQNIVNRIYLIAVNGILGNIGNKYNGYIGICFP